MRIVPELAETMEINRKSREAAKGKELESVKEREAAKEQEKANAEDRTEYDFGLRQRYA